MEFTITFNSIEAKTSGKGTQFWKLKDTNGEDYTIWNEDLADLVVIGQPLKCIIKESNGYKNIRGIGGQTGAPVSSPKPKPQVQNSPPETKGLSSSKQEYHLTIEQVRSNALDIAFKVMSIANVKLNPASLISNATTFENYILNGNGTKTDKKDE